MRCSHLEGCNAKRLFESLSAQLNHQHIYSIRLTKTSLTNLIRPTHWFQFTNNASVVTGQEYETQILLNAFSTWCTWSKMITRVDKCHTFGITKKSTTSTQNKQSCMSKTK